MLSFKSRSLGYLAGLATVAALAAGYASAGDNAYLQQNSGISPTPPPAAICRDCARPYAKLPLNPPAHFNALTATGAELDVYGFPPRPNAKTSPAEYADWAKVVTSHATRIVPQLRATKISNGPVKRLVSPRKNGVKNGVLGSTSGNWSGYAIEDGTDPFAATNTKIISTLIVPTAQQAFGTCTGGLGGWDYSSEWVGIDGYKSSDVFQAGIEADAFCRNGTTLGYYGAWYEWYPNDEVEITNFPISPGDEIHLYIWNTSSTTGKMYMLDENTNKTVSVSFSAPAGTQLIGDSVEWVVERPGINNALATLTNYISDEWESAVVDNGAHQYSPAAGPTTGQIYSLTMLDDSSAPISTAATSAKNLIYTNPANATTTTAGTAIWFANEGSSRGP